VVPPPPLRYSCNLPPSHFSLFLRIISHLGGRRFQGVPEILEKSLSVQQVIPIVSIRGVAGNGRNAGTVA
jgi:hypothetical protein